MAEIRKTRTYQLLLQLTPKERGRFSRFVRSPYFNQSKELVILFDILHVVLKDNKGNGNISKENVWSQLESGKKYNNTRLRKYFSDLSKLVERFLIIETLEDHDLQKAILLVEAGSDRKVPQIQSSSLRKLIEQYGHFPFRTPEYYLAGFRTEKARYESIDYETQREQKSNLESISDHLDLFFLSEKLRLLSMAASRKNIIDHEYDIAFSKEVLKAVEEGAFDHIPPIAIYRQILLTYLNQGRDEHYFALKQLLSQYGHLFPEKEAVDTLYNAAQNYCVKKINAGERTFLAESFALFQDMLDKGFLKETMTPWYFRNIVTIGLRLGEHEWVENFLGEYENSLPEELRHNAVSFNLAQLYFYRKEFEKVIDLLQHIEYDDLTYNLNSKVTLLFTYYEMNEIEPLMSLLDSFRKFLTRREELPTNRRKSYQDLIKYTRRLASLPPGDKENIQKLGDEIRANPHVASADKLLEKLKELE